MADIGFPGIRADSADPSLCASANQIMIPLLSIIEDSTLRDAVRALNRGSESQLRADRAVSPEGQLVAVLIELSASDGRDAIPVGDIADAFKRKHGLDYDRPITARYIGYLLRKRLHLPVSRRQGVFVVDCKDRQQLAGLAARYGVSDEAGTRSEASPNESLN